MISVGIMASFLILPDPTVIRVFQHVQSCCSKKKKFFFGTIQRYWDMYRTLQNAGKEARGVTAAVDISQAHGIRITQ